MWGHFSADILLYADDSWFYFIIFLVYFSLSYCFPTSMGVKEL